MRETFTAKYIWMSIAASLLLTPFWNCYTFVSPIKKSCRISIQKADLHVCLYVCDANNAWLIL